MSDSLTTKYIWKYFVCRSGRLLRGFFFKDCLGWRAKNVLGKKGFPGQFLGHFLYGPRMLSFVCHKETTDKKTLLTLSKKVTFGSSTFGQQFWKAPSCPFLNFWTGSGCPKVLSFFTADLEISWKFRPHRRHTHQTQASPMLRWLPPLLLLLAGSRRGTCLTPPTSNSLGSLSMAAPGVDVLLPATALVLALVALDEAQRDDF